jgi:glutamate racemase
VLVFDSGIGGLSIVAHIRDALPNATITYLADNALFPYGLLEEQRLVERVCKIVSQACQQHNTDIVVIGCNSASTLVLPHLREKLSIPVVGVVPAIKPAAQLSSNKVIGLLATPGTINRDYTNGLISTFASECEIIRLGSSELVELIEAKYRGVQQTHAEFDEILKPLRAHIGWKNVDTVILACTHFPLALKELSIAAPEVTHWIDSGAAIARQVRRLLMSKPKPIKPSKNIALFTQINSVNSALKKNLNQFGFHTVEHWTSTEI